jgi:pimeloyl-ACP methyl ester carboxylesterase
VLLHGFPECWYGWRHQLGPLADAGYRVVAPDQRGYNLSDKPPGLDAYTRAVLARDVLGILDHFGAERANVVGHDWGGAVAWWVALQHPERVSRLAALNLPHPIVFARALKGSRQALRSWYIALFQLPWLPEALLSRNRFQPLVDVLKRSVRPGTLTPDELEVYREAYAQPGALRAMLDWYRAAARRRSEPLHNRRVKVPATLIWGQRDTALGSEMAAPSVGYCDRGELHLLEHAGHFVQLDAPDEVNQRLLDWLRRDAR